MKSCLIKNWILATEILVNRVFFSGGPLTPRCRVQHVAEKRTTLAGGRSAAKRSLFDVANR